MLKVVKKFFILLIMFTVGVTTSGCTKQVVFTNRTIEQTKLSFDNFIKTTGYTYKIKDDVNNIYNIHMATYNIQYLLQSKPIISEELGFSCCFRALNNNKDTLATFKTYPSTSGIGDIRRYLKEQRWDDIKYIPYKKYKKENL